MGTLGLRWPNVIAAGRFSPLGLLFRVDDGNFCDIFHFVAPFGLAFPLSNLQEDVLPLQVSVLRRV
jgi:hypothetical protein